MLRPKRPCNKPGCRVLTNAHFCDAHQPKRTNVFKATHTNAWRNYSKAFLARHPICADPFGRHRGRLIEATVTDHVIAHKGDMELFWDQSNHQGLCNECNAYKCVKSEGGFGNAIDKGEAIAKAI